MNVFNPQVLFSLIYEARDRTDQTLVEIAKRMGGISSKYLSRQLNPDDPDAKLGIEDFIYFIDVTDFEPLDYIEQAFDRIAIPIPSDGDITKKEWLQHIGHAVKEAGEAVSTLAEAVADGKVTEKEKTRCRKELYEALQAMAGLWNKLNTEQGEK